MEKIWHLITERIITNTHKNPAFTYYKDFLLHLVYNVVNKTSSCQQDIIISCFYMIFLANF